MQKLLLVITLLASTQVTAMEHSTTLYLPGMNCAMCPITVKKSLQNVSGVRSVQVSYEKKTALVIYDDSIVSIQALQDATANAGYPASIRQRE